LDNEISSGIMKNSTKIFFFRGIYIYIGLYIYIYLWKLYGLLNYWNKLREIDLHRY